MIRRHAIAMVTSLTVGVLLCASLAFAQGDKSSATIDQFREYGDIIVGRWVAEITLTDDYPGLGKKGDKLTCHSTTKWIADKKRAGG